MNKPVQNPPHVSFIVTCKKYNHHGDYNAADTERNRLAASHPGKQFRVMKILNVSGAPDQAAIDATKEG